MPGDLSNLFPHIKREPKTLLFKPSVPKPKKPPKYPHHPPRRIIPKAPEFNKETDVVLAVDVGAKTGWAMRKPDGAITSGFWNFNRKQNHGAGRRFVDFADALTDCMAEHAVTHVVYEKPVRFQSAAANQSIFGYIAHLESICERKNIRYMPVHPLSLKNFATGTGKADKEMMLAAARVHWTDREFKTHDEADAMWILDWGLSKWAGKLSVRVARKGTKKARRVRRTRIDKGVKKGRRVA